MTFDNKRILILAPKFYGYGESIAGEMENQGACKVTLINCDPSPFLTNIIKGFSKVKIVETTLKKIFSCLKLQKEKALLNEKYDYILVVCGWALSDEFFESLRANSLSCKGRMVLYYWDSRKNLQDKESRYSYFDSVKSFDSNDCEANKFELLPLFFRKEYTGKEEIICKKKEYDLSIVASYNFFRYEIVDKIQKLNLTKRIFSYLYANRKIVYLHKFIRKKCRSVDIRKLAFKSLQPDEITRIYDSSYAILDLPHPNQSGLSIRTIECLAMKKKIITTNIAVKNYDFYNPNNIFILSGDYILPDNNWFLHEYESVDPIIVENYCITNWVKRVFR